MDIEKFTDLELQNELLKIVDEMSNRGTSRKDIIDHIDNGKRF